MFLQVSKQVGQYRQRRRQEEEVTHLGTATRMVSRYSESFVPEKSEAETTSASDRIDRFPLYMVVSSLSTCRVS